MDHVKGVQVDLETKLATVEVEAPNLIDAMNMLPTFVQAIKVAATMLAAGRCGHAATSMCKLGALGVSAQFCGPGLTTVCWTQVAST
jgi:hypothetical protein